MAIWTPDETTINENDNHPFELLVKSLEAWLDQQTDEGRKKIMDALEVDIPYKG